MKIIFFSFLLASCITPQSAYVGQAYNPDTAFNRFNHENKRKRKQLQSDLETLKQKLFAAQKNGRDVTCSRHISEEANAALGENADLQFAEGRLRDLERSLDDTRSQSWAQQQSSQDGSWGPCYKQWYWKLVESAGQIRELNHEKKLPKYQVSFLDRINSPEKLTAYLDSILISDIDKDGANHRRELNESGTTLVKLIAKGIPKNYPYHPQLLSTLYDYLDKKWQNPHTGFWGAWFQDGSNIIKTDDLSITFHIVSYRRNDPPNWDKIARTTLAIKDRSYPFGWLDSKGQMSNHHNYDVVRLLRLGWEHLAESERQGARIELRKMLYWCLDESLQADGSFRYNHSDDSLGDSYYFGVSFLAELGYFDKNLRFWTSDDFPEAERIQQRILENLRKISNQDPMMRSAIAVLEGRD